MIRRASTQRHRTFAATACVLWLLAVEVLPNLHLAFHDDDHTHASTGQIVVLVTHGDPRDRHHDHDHGDRHDHDHDHDHDPVDHEPARDHDRGVDVPGELAIGLPGAGHAAAGLAHRALALHQPPPPDLAPVAIDRATWWVTLVSTERTAAARAGRPTARGPPA